jgi:hypothetical protein
MCCDELNRSPGETSVVDQARIPGESFMAEGQREKKKDKYPLGGEKIVGSRLY